MNVERMLQLAEAIEKETLACVDFSMVDFISRNQHRTRAHHVGDVITCGTAGCIGGWAVLLFGERGAPVGYETARTLLELNFMQADRLFYNGEYYISPNPLNEITRAEAVAAIRRMAAETGK